MKASRICAATGALIAAIGVLAPSGAMSAPGGIGLSFHGAARAPIGGFHAPFHRTAVFDHRAPRRRGRDDFDSFDGTGAVPGEPPQEALGAPLAPLEADFTPMEAPGWVAARSAGPKIIEIGRRPLRHVHWPVVVYGDR